MSEDYKKALEIIKKCKEYVKHNIEGCVNLRTFEERHLLKLGHQENYYHRGGCDTYLTLSKHHGLSTIDVCGDGTCWKHDIYTTEEPYAYAYNNNEEKTIKLALCLIDNWNEIKAKLGNVIDDIVLRAAYESKRLEEFEP